MILDTYRHIPKTWWYGPGFAGWPRKLRCQGYDFEGNHLPWQSVHTGATSPGAKNGMMCTRNVDCLNVCSVCQWDVNVFWIPMRLLVGVSRCIRTGTMPIDYCLWCGLKLPIRSIPQAPPFDTRCPPSLSLLDPPNRDSPNGLC